jgi:hypothetical protein
MQHKPWAALKDRELKGRDVLVKHLAQALKLYEAAPG